MGYKNILAVFFYFFFLASCSTTTTQSLESQTASIKLPLNTDIFQSEVFEVTPEQDVFSLSTEQKQQVLAYVEEKSALGIAKHHIVRDYMQNNLSNFAYYGETFVAEKAYALNKGNCMSLAILTSAIAELAGVEYQFREVNTLPVFTKQNNLLLSSTHVQTILFDPAFIPEEGKMYFMRPAVVIDYFPDSDNRKGKYFKNKPFMAMYYKNIASDALVSNNLDKAFVYANKAYQLDSANTSVINLLAVLHKRKGDLATAEQIYKAGLQIDKNNLALISNYVVLLELLNRKEEANQLSEQLVNLNDPNPYSWLEQAMVAQHKNSPRQAIKFYKKVLKMAPYVHQAYQGLYQIYNEQGKRILARAMLKNALEWTYELKEKKAYKFKLYQLEQKMPTHHKRV